MICINGVCWRLLFVPPTDTNLYRMDGSLTVGMCDNRRKTIYINENLTGLFLKKVLCHELVHASMFSYGVYLTEDQEELVADLLATYGEEVVEKTNLIFSKLQGWM